jgi:hypothetical protein
VPRKSDDPDDIIIDLYEKEIKKRKLRRELERDEGGDDEEDVLIKLQKEELKRNRLRRDNLRIEKEIVELEKPKPSVLDEIVAEFNKQIIPRVGKEMADRVTSGFEKQSNSGTSAVSLDFGSWNPTGGSTNVRSETTEEKAVMLDEKGLGQFRGLKPPLKDKVFPRVLAGMTRLPQMRRLIGKPLIRDGKPASYDSGEQMYEWTEVLYSTKPSDATNTREAILRELGMEVEVLTLTEGLERGLVDEPGDKKRAEKPAGPDHPSGTPAPSQSSEAGRRSIFEPAKPGDVKPTHMIISPERFRLLDPPQKNVLFTKVLPAVNDLPEILGAIYKPGNQNKSWTIVVGSLNPEVANQAREIIRKEMGMDVAVMDAGEFSLEEAINEKGEDGRPLLTEPVISVLRSN